MDNELMTKEVNYLVNGEEVKLTGSTVKNYLTRGNDNVSDQEVVMFINLCRYQKLNPFLNEAYLVKFKGAPAQIITSKEAYMKKAERTKDFNGMRAGIIVQRGDEIVELEGSFCLPTDKLLGGWCQVFKKDRKMPYVVKLNFDEYNKGQSTWKSMPKTMIRKVAIVQALREAFPEDLGALYTEDEVQAISSQGTEAAVKAEITDRANKKVLSISQDNPIQNDNPEVTSKEQSVPTDQQQMSIGGGPGF